MRSDNKPKLLIADDHELIVKKVTEIVADEFNVVATLSDGANVAETVARLQPQVILLDICMPLVDGLTAARRVKRLGVPVGIVFLTVGEDGDCVHSALALGASYVLKRRMHIDLLEALNASLAGRTFISPLTAVAVPVAK
jgi:DNA-binding NarL/FixJ family response regulator